MKPITTTNLITIFATISVITGWFVNSRIQRRHEITKERFRIRIEMLKGALNILNSIKNTDPTNYINHFTSTDFKKKFTKIDEDFLVYGTENEIECWTIVADLIKKNSFSNLQNYTEITINQLKMNIRKELNL